MFLLKNMEVTGKSIPASKFDDVNLEGTVFNNVNLRTSTFSDINFERAKIFNVNMKDVELSDCNLTGMTIDGIAVEDLFKAYEDSRKSGS